MNKNRIEGGAERGEKSAEVVVAKSKPARQFTDTGSLWRCEGPNEKESETNMHLVGKRPQMTRQLELPLDARGAGEQSLPRAIAGRGRYGNPSRECLQPELGQ